MAVSSPAYSWPGTTRHPTGVWLVSWPDGAAGIYDRSDLPARASGIRYYWLGNTPAQAQSGVDAAIGKLGLNVEQIPTAQGIAPAFKGKPVGIAGNIPVTPGQTFPKSPGTAPGATYPKSPAPISTFVDAVNAVTSVSDFLKLLAWIITPRNLLRIVETIFGVLFMAFGFWAAVQARGESREGFETGEMALTRSGLGRVASALGRQARGASGRVESAPHRTRRAALRQRYTREETVRRRHLTKPAGHSRRGKGPGGKGP